MQRALPVRCTWRWPLSSEDDRGCGPGSGRVDRGRRCVAVSSQWDCRVQPDGARRQAQDQASPNSAVESAGGRYQLRPRGTRACRWRCWWKIVEDDGETTTAAAAARGRCAGGNVRGTRRYCSLGLEWRSHSHLDSRQTHLTTDSIVQNPLFSLLQNQQSISGRANSAVGAPLQRAATWRVKRKNRTAIVRPFGKFHADSYQRDDVEKQRYKHSSSKTINLTAGEAR